MYLCRDTPHMEPSGTTSQPVAICTTRVPNSIFAEYFARTNESNSAVVIRLGTWQERGPAPSLSMPSKHFYRSRIHRGATSRAWLGSALRECRPCADAPRGSDANHIRSE